MKYATWNINECVGITCDLNNQDTVDTVNYKNIEEIINIINDYDIDVICFQEYPTYIDEKISLTNEIINKTGLKYYSEKDTYDSYIFNGGRVGVAVFSKYEIVNTYYSLFNNPHLVKESSSGKTRYSFDKGIIKIVINKDGINYTIITGHAIAFAPFDKTEFDYPESYKPLEELIISSNEDNLIVLGDFNTENLFQIIPRVNDVVKDVINGPTTKDYYEKRGEVHMDYIMINKNMKCNNLEKIDNFSDHYVMCADISDNN